MVKNPPDNAGDTGSIPGSEIPLEKEMTIYSSILAWKIPQRSMVGYSSAGTQLSTQASNNVRGRDLYAVAHGKIRLFPVSPTFLMIHYVQNILCTAMQLLFPVAQTVKNLPTMQETRVRSVDWEVPLDKGMAVHSSILAWRIPWTEKRGGLAKSRTQLSD